MKKKYSFIVPALVLLSFIGLSQSVNEKRIQKDIKALNFQAIIDKYEGSKDKSYYIYKALAQSYRNIGNMDKAENCYYFIAQSDSCTLEDLLAYIQVLRANGKYKESEKFAEKFLQRDSTNLYVNNLLSNKSLLERINSNVERFEVFPLLMNTEAQDFGIAFYGKRVVFASTRSEIDPIQRKDNLTGMDFLDLYSARQNSDGQLVDLLPFDKKFNKKFHDGPATFDFEHKNIAFTRNNYHSKAKDGSINMEIYFSRVNKKGKWMKPVPFKYNSTEYSVFHPSFSADGDTLYFASDMPGGYGGADLYKVVRNDRGRWDEAVNLGPEINSQMNEVFPFIYDGKYLFFASDGHYGLGQLDIYIADISEKTIRARNLGAPINSKYDDFAIALDYNGEMGYFSSNRIEGKGSDDIYGIKVLRSLDDKALIKGTLTDKVNRPLQYPIAYLYDSSNVKIDSVEGDHLGVFKFEVAKNQRYRVSAYKSNYYMRGEDLLVMDRDVYEINIATERKPDLRLFCIISDKENHHSLENVEVNIFDKTTRKSYYFKTKRAGNFMLNLQNDLGDKLSYEITLSKPGYITKKINYNKIILYEGVTELHNEIDMTMQAAEENTDLATLVDAMFIYFDLGDASIRPDAAMEIDKVVDVLNMNPELKIKVCSHTDCRSDSYYNLKLSKERAASIANYIKNRISKPERVSHEGYGDSKPIVPCSCTSMSDPCSQEDMQTNRRTEFLIVE